MIGLYFVLHVFEEALCDLFAAHQHTNKNGKIMLRESGIWILLYIYYLYFYIILVDSVSHKDVTSVTNC